MPKQKNPTLSDLVDEIGDIEAVFLPLDPLAKRLTKLRAEVRALYDAQPAGEAFEAHGTRFVLAIGARSNVRTIDVPKLFKLIGAKIFVKIASVTLTALEATCDVAVVADVVTTAQTGSRPLASVQKGKAAA